MMMTSSTLKTTIMTTTATATPMTTTATKAVPMTHVPRAGDFLREHTRATCVKNPEAKVPRNYETSRKHSSAIKHARWFRRWNAYIGDRNGKKLDDCSAMKHARWF